MHSLDFSQLAAILYKACLFTETPFLNMAPNPLGAMLSPSYLTGLPREKSNGQELAEKNFFRWGAPGIERWCPIIFFTH